MLDFVQRTEGVSLREALRPLGGAGPAVGRSGPAPKSKDSGIAVLPPRDTAVLTAAVRFYGGQLRRSPRAQAYLASRGIRPETAMRSGLGYAPGRELQVHLESQGFTTKRLQDSGLVSENGTERFAGMLVVPEVVEGRVRWLAGRAIDPTRSPRFQSLPGPKPVLGLRRLGSAPRWLALTEGLFDWLALTQWGLPACAALGTQGLERVAEALRGCPRVLLAFDSDEAGRAASQCLNHLLGRRVAIVALPEGVGDDGRVSRPSPRTRCVPTPADTGLAYRDINPGFPTNPSPPHQSPPDPPSTGIPSLTASGTPRALPTWEELCPSLDGVRPADGLRARSPHRSRLTTHEGDTK